MIDRLWPELLPGGYVFEPGSIEAIDEAADCLEAFSKASTDLPSVSAESLSAMWSLPEFDIGQDVMLVRDGRGDVVGVETAESTSPHAAVYSFGGVRPGHTGNGIGSALIAWATQAAASRIDRAPTEAQVTHEIFYPAEHEPSARLVANHGFSVHRYFNRMAISFDEAPAPPAVPDGIEIRQLRAGIDDEVAAVAADEAFQDHYGHIPRPVEALVERLRHWIGNEHCDPELFWLAWEGDTIAGHLWGWPTADLGPDHGYVGSLGVRRLWRGRGLGRALLLRAFHEFHRRGKRGAELEVDAASLTGATRLYESVGMRTLVVHAQALREIRPGTPLAKTSLDE